jgi:hypothetical protein
MATGILPVPDVTVSLDKMTTLTQRIKAKTLDFYKISHLLGTGTPVSPAAPMVPAPQATAPPEQTPVILSPVDISGFYTVTAPQEITFYVTTNITADEASAMGIGWTAVGITGIQGQIQVTGAHMNPGVIKIDSMNSQSYLWAFTLQSDTSQSIEGLQYATGAILYPPGQIKATIQKIIAPLYGRYQITPGTVNFYFSVPPPPSTSIGWIVENLPGIKAPLQVASYSPGVATYAANPNTFTGAYTSEILATLQTVDGSPLPNTDAPVYVNGAPAVIHEADYTTTFVPGFFTVENFTQAKVILNQNIKLGDAPGLRDLNTDLPLDPPPVQKYIDLVDRGFSQGSILALNAIGPQEDYLVSNEYAKSQFSPLYKQYTNFVQFQRVTPFPPPNPSYQGNVLQIELRPTELGHLLSNMYLHVKLPALAGYVYSQNIGRALIKQIDLLVNETIIETLYDDWYIIRDQLFLDADEQNGVRSAVNVQSNVSVPILGTGGDNIWSVNSNTVHTFTTNGVFTLNTASQVNLLIVGGGGAGASGTYVPTLTSNISNVLSVPSTFVVSVNSTAGAYKGANVSIVSSDGSFSPVVYVQGFNSSSLTLATYGGTPWNSNLTPANTTLSIFNGNGGGGGGVLNQSVFLLPGTYVVNVGAGGTQSSPNGGSSSLGGYLVTGGFGGAYGGAAGSVGLSNTALIFNSNIVYESGGGAGQNANVATGTGSAAFTTAGTLGSGGNGYAYSNAITLSVNYFGGGGGGAANTSIVGTLATPGGLGGGGAGAVTVYPTQTIAAVSGTKYIGGGGGGSYNGTAGNGGSGAVVVWYSATANVSPSSDIITPLEFFFCRRHSVNNKARERLRRPYFPLCAMWNQRMYVRFTFQPNVWWCNAPVGSQIDIYDPSTTILPTLITEEILLNDEERLYYMSTPLKYLVPRVQKESTLSFSGNQPKLELTASFPVQTIAWFFRNKNYENVSDGRYSDSRYNYGYTTQYIATGIQLQFPSGNSNFVDVISTAKITLNNVDILSTFQGSLYYSFKQPLEHGLSIPSKNIYTYSFGLTPKEYNQGGYLNFSKLNSQTTYLQLTFNPQYTAQITQGYNLYLFYYGYTLLVFQGGFATTPFQ